MSKQHDLKTWIHYFQEVKAGRKNFEVRLNDRNYQVGDILFMREFCPEEEFFTGDCLIRKVDYVLKGGSFGIQEGYCVMSISEL